MHRAPLDLDYFEAGVDFLRAQPQVRSEAGVGLIGISMGSKVVLTMAKFLPPGKISSVVAMCSYLNFLFTDVVYKGSTVLKGQMFDMSKVYDMVKHKGGNVVNILETSDLIKVEGDTSTIPFYDSKDIHFMFVAGSDDQNHDVMRAVSLAILCSTFSSFF